jgi:hypothetical protein
MGRVAEAAKRIEQQNARGATAEPAGSELAALVASKRRELLDEAEQIILRHADQFAGRTPWDIRRPFATDELALFDSLNWSLDDLRGEVGRVIGIARWQADAGTSAERETTAKRLDKARRELDDKGAALKQQIATLEDELAGLERSHGSAARDAERQQRGIDELRKLAPPHAKEAYARAFAVCDQRRQCITELADRGDFIKRAAKMPMQGGLTDVQNAFTFAYAHCPHIIVRGTRDADVAINLDLWDAWLAEKHQELLGIEQQLAEAKAAYERDAAEAAKLLDVYAR